MEDITPAEIDSQLNDYLQGEVVTSYLGTVQEVGVRLWLDPPNERVYQSQLRDLLIRAPSGMSTEGVRHVTGRLDPAMKGNFSSREVSYILRAQSQFQERCLSLNSGTERPLAR